MALELSIREFRARIRGLSAILNKAGLPIMRRYTSEVRKEAREAYRNTQVGRKLWKKSKQYGAPALVLKTMRAQLNRSARTWTGGIVVKGMAAILEQGLSTAPHTIKARQSPYLVFRTRTGNVIRAKSVSHPGSKFRKYAVINRAQRKTLPAVQAEMETVISRLLSERFR